MRKIEELKSAVVINPNTVSQINDFYGTGIPYLPLGAAYLAGNLVPVSFNVSFIDMYGSCPKNVRMRNNFLIHGKTLNRLVQDLAHTTFDYVFIYASQVIQHSRILNIIQRIKQEFPNKKIVVFENTQAVTAYSLEKVYNEFFEAGANFVILGEPEIPAQELITGKQKKDISGLIYKRGFHIIKNEVQFSDITEIEKILPLWEKVPLTKYWELNYAHAPVNKNSRFIALQTSRGCNNCCKFCIVPYTNKHRWRSMSVNSIIKTIKYFRIVSGIDEVHIEDLNATFNNDRIKKLCQTIIKEKIKINIKFASGIKLETIDKETLRLLKTAGCAYISFSPESGSINMLNKMNKHFNLYNGIKMTKYMHKLGIKTQACFVIGFPGETNKDRKLTSNYIHELTNAGVDEIALFIMTPIPGSEVHEQYQIKKEDISKMTFSPEWRKEYNMLNKYRNNLYIKFLLWKLIYHPFKLFKQGINMLTKNFETKMEMTLYRILKTKIRTKCK